MSDLTGLDFSDMPELDFVLIPRDVVHRLALVLAFDHYSEAHRQVCLEHIKKLAPLLHEMSCPVARLERPKDVDEASEALNTFLRIIKDVECTE